MVKAKKLIVSALACMAALAMTATAIAADFTPQDAKERAEETKSYLSAMNVKGSGMDEWGLIGLSLTSVQMAFQELGELTENLPGEAMPER